MKTDEEFKTFYESELVQKAVLLEGLRLKTKRNLTAFYFIYCIVAFLSLCAIAYLCREAMVYDHDRDAGIHYHGIFAVPDTYYSRSYTRSSPLRPIGMSIAIIVMANMTLLLVAHNIKRGYRLSFRKNIILPMLDFFNKGLKYMPEKELSYEAIRLSSLFNNMGGYHARDYIEGTVNKTFVQMAVLNLTRGISIGEDAFKGLVVITPLNAVPIEDKVIVYSWPHDDLYVDMYKRDTLTLKPEDYGTDDFKREFTTFTTKKALLPGILTPSAMQWMLSLKERSGTHVCFSFTRRSMFMAVHSDKNIFEPSINSPVKEEDVFGWAKSLHIVMQAITEFQSAKPRVSA